MSLTHAKKGECFTLEYIESGNRAKRKLQDMGLTPGVKICVVSNSSFGPIILELRGSRIALGRGLVDKIAVRRIDE
ncbi:MAG: FeoA domain-containing protein [Tissierellales bacterium]|jgi:ferrous iron transport protein A|nr:FeoA domain-containing protein [Tissierellales bacterium]MBN2827238.1 FeoA domain-containing protein [Tissierellales bacterium]